MDVRAQRGVGAPGQRQGVLMDVSLLAEGAGHGVMFGWLSHWMAASCRTWGGLLGKVPVGEKNRDPLLPTPVNGEMPTGKSHRQFRELEQETALGFKPVLSHPGISFFS